VFYRDEEEDDDEDEEDEPVKFRDFLYR